MTFQLRHQAWGLAAAIVGFVAYAIVIAVRASTDDAPLTQVAWQHPLQWFIGAGVAVYAIIYAASWWSTRGAIRTDERDAEIGRRADSAGAGFAAIGAVVAMVLLTLNAEAFWVVHVLFVFTFLGSLASTGLTWAAYTNGLDQ